MPRIQLPPNSGPPLHGQNQIESTSNLSKPNQKKNDTAIMGQSGSSIGHSQEYSRAITAKRQRPNLSIEGRKKYFDEASAHSQSPPQSIQSTTARSAPSIDSSSNKRRRLYDSPLGSFPNIDPVRQSRNTATFIPMTPPITLNTLKELDLYEILDQEQLRHDLVLNNSLLFRPNNDGER
jgi:hypothetical protein